MNIQFTKITLIILTLVIFSACNVTKKLEKDSFLITEHEIIRKDSVSEYRELYNQLRQEPNSKLLGFPLKLHIYNLAKDNPEQSFINWVEKKPKRKQRLVSVLSQKQVVQLKKSYININEGIKKSGERPAIFDETLAEESTERLEDWFWNHGWFNAKSEYSVDKDSANQYAKVTYKVFPGKAYIIDTITENIESEAADSLYQLIKKQSFIKTGEPYNTTNFNLERDRIAQHFRNQGLYHFEKEYISFYADTINTDHKIKLEINITNREIQERDSTISIPFKVHKISDVNVFTDYDGTTTYVEDSTMHNNINIFSFGLLKFRPKAISNLIFIKKDSIYRDIDRSRTNSRVSETRIFEYPNVQYQNDPRDSTNTDLIANVFLTPKELFSTDFSVDISQSNIQEFGIGFNSSLLARNVFRGAETLELSGRGNFGSSRDAANPDDQFLNILEYGTDLRLSFPKIIFPFVNGRIIDKRMSPFTSASIGFSSQQNIGLDRRNLNATFGYRWKPRRELSYQLDLMNIQFVNNLNIDNFFNVFRNSYSELNTIAQDNIDQLSSDFFTEVDPGETPNLSIPSGANSFINAIRNNEVNLDAEERQTANSLIERKERLTENNLIIASNFSYDFSTRKNIYDEDFSQFRAKLELAGNLLNMLAEPIGLKQGSNNNYRLFDVQFSQYAKMELNFIKRWDLGDQQVFAARAYGGLAIPYGNSNSIPFARSFFAGGPNDNRGWRPYDLGPGKTNGVNDFNEANFKLSFNGEYRFNLFGALNSAVFIDAGNIWNLWDNVEDPEARFDGLEDLSELSIASGFGLRYDLEFFVIRADLGFKTFNPGSDGQKWFKDYNFANVVFNFGINYPF